MSETLTCSRTVIDNQEMFICTRNNQNVVPFINQPLHMDTGMDTGMESEFEIENFATQKYNFHQRNTKRPYQGHTTSPSTKIPTGYTPENHYARVYECRVGYHHAQGKCVKNAPHKISGFENIDNYFENFGPN